jgi:hypothetical protein
MADDRSRHEVSGESDAGRVPGEIRSRLALALDMDDLVGARRLVSLLGPYFGTLKVGRTLLGIRPRCRGRLRR